MNRKEWESMNRPEDDDSFFEIFAGVVIGFCAVVLLIWAIDGKADAASATGCDEWATMTQVLVIRWQGDKTFEGKTNIDVKAQLEKQMKGHPELDKAKGYVDYEYVHRKENPVHVWKQVYSKCSAVNV